MKAPKPMTPQKYVKVLTELMRELRAAQRQVEAIEVKHNAATKVRAEVQTRFNDVQTAFYTEISKASQ